MMTCNNLHGIFFSSLLSWWQFFPEQLSQFQCSQFSSQLWTHPTQLSAWTSTKASKTVQISKAQVCRKYSSVTTSSHSITNPTVHVTATLPLSFTRTLSWQLQYYSVFPSKTTLLSTTGETNFSPQKC